jgi:hypothetical protein
MQLLRDLRFRLALLAAAMLLVFVSAARADQTPAGANAAVLAASSGPTNVPGLNSVEGAGTPRMDTSAVAGAGDETSQTSGQQPTSAGVGEQTQQPSGSPTPSSTLGNSGPDRGGNAGAITAGNVGPSAAATGDDDSETPSQTLDNQPAPSNQPAPNGQLAPGNQPAPSGQSAPTVRGAPNGITDTGEEAPETSIAQPAQPDTQGLDPAALAATSTPSDASGTAVPVESNATSQLIWQLQVSGCAANCQGISQTQLAAQQNNTVQAVAGGAQLVGTPGTQSTVVAAPQPSASGITQIQVGCIAQCLGSTTVGPPVPESVAQTVAQVISVVLTGTGLPAMQIVPAAEQNAVSQTASQLQFGATPGDTQTQSASQSNATVQIVASSLAAAIQATLSNSSSSPAEIVNQTQQEIWQLQVGCLIFCSQTQQYQQAAQSNTTVQVLQLAGGSTPSTTPTAVDSVTQVIWQLQIGCLLWCLDTTQQQTATSDQSRVLTILSPDSPGSVSDPPGTAGNGGAPQTPGGPSTPASGPDAGAGADASAPVPVSQGFSSGPPAATVAAEPSAATSAAPRTTLPSIQLLSSGPQRESTAGNLDPQSSSPLRHAAVPHTLLRAPSPGPQPLVAQRETTALSTVTAITGGNARLDDTHGSEQRSGLAPIRLVPHPGTSSGKPHAAEAIGSIAPVIPAIVLAAALALAAMVQLQRRSRAARHGSHTD